MRRGMFDAARWTFQFAAYGMVVSQAYRDWLGSGRRSEVKLLNSKHFDWLAYRVEENPTARAMTFDGMTWTYAELYHDASVIAQALNDDFNIESGDYVATLLGNIPEHALIIHALMLLGAIFVPLNIRLATPELQRQIELIRPKLLISTEHLDVTDGAAIELRQLVRRIGLRAASAPTVSRFAPTADTIQCIIFTSGSSGVSKPVPLTYGNHRANAAGSATNLGVCEDDNWLCLIPLCHVGGLAIILRSALYGTAFTLVERPDTDLLPSHAYSCLIAARTLVRDEVRPRLIVPEFYDRFTGPLPPSTSPTPLIGWWQDAGLVWNTSNGGRTWSPEAGPTETI